MVRENEALKLAGWFIFTFAFLLTSPAVAGDPDHWGKYPPEIHAWFPTVMQPGNEDMHDAAHSCCGAADAYEVRAAGEDPLTGEILVIIDDGKGFVPDGTVVHVPKNKIQAKYGNPFVDKLILFMNANSIVFCLVPISGM